MATIEVSRPDWTSFLDTFTRMHAGWLVTIEVLRPDIGAQVATRDLPLDGISFDEGGGDRDRILIEVKARGGAHVAHAIIAPKLVSLKQTDEGAHEALEIESADGAKTLVRFRSTLLPQMLDGYVGP